MVSGRVNCSHKNGPISLPLASHMMTLKSLPPNLCALVGPINITTNAIKMYKTFNITTMLITAFDTDLTPRSTRVMSLVYRYVNLEEPYNQDIKDMVTAKFFLKIRQALHEIPYSSGIVCRKCFSNSIRCLWC